MHYSDDDRKKFLVFVSYYCNADNILNIIDHLSQSVDIDDFVIVSNNHDITFPSAAKVIYGSNRLLDMSGYYEGYTYFLNSGQSSKSDIVIFANDSIYHKHSIWALTVSASLLFNRFKLPTSFYSGIPSEILGFDSAHYKYFSTYFFISDFFTIAECFNSIGNFYLRERKRIVPIIRGLPLSRWSPRTAVRSLDNVARLKRKCVTLEFIFSYYAIKKEIYLPLPLFSLARVIRFFIKVKNFFLKNIKIAAKIIF